MSYERVCEKGSYDRSVEGVYVGVVVWMRMFIIPFLCIHSRIPDDWTRRPGVRLWLGYG